MIGAQSDFDLMAEVVKVGANPVATRLTVTNTFSSATDKIEQWAIVEVNGAK